MDYITFHCMQFHAIHNKGSILTLNNAYTDKKFSKFSCLNQTDIIDRSGVTQPSAPPCQPATCVFPPFLL